MGVEEVRALRIAPEVYDAIIVHLRAGLPNEGCGLLATIDRRDGARQVVRFYPGDNIDRSPTRYTMDPRQVIDAIDDLEARGWELGAIVHSHPRTAPVPSRTDLNEAYYAESLFAIVSFMAEVPLMRVWRLAPGRAEQPFAEIALQVGDRTVETG